MHRDIKPDNFLIGLTEATKNTIFIIDFGLAKCYIDSEGMHIPSKKGKSLTGTARYASLNTHLGFELSRRDDLESIGLMLIYFITGTLPWYDLGHYSNKSDKYKKITKIMNKTSLEELC